MSPMFRALSVAGVVLVGGLAGSAQPADANQYYQCGRFESGPHFADACSGKNNGNHKGGAAWIRAYLAAHAGWSLRKDFVENKNPCKKYTCWNP